MKQYTVVKQVLLNHSEISLMISGGRSGRSSSGFALEFRWIPILTSTGICRSTGTTFSAPGNSWSGLFIKGGIFCSRTPSLPLLILSSKHCQSCSKIFRYPWRTAWAGQCYQLFRDFYGWNRSFIASSWEHLLRGRAFIWAGRDATLWIGFGGVLASSGRRRAECCPEFRISVCGAGSKQRGGAWVHRWRVLFEGAAFWWAEKERQVRLSVFTRWWRWGT